MFEDLKETILEIAHSAVVYAEKTFATSSGKRKKQEAIQFLVGKLPIALPFKQIVAIVLSKFIDTAIENAVSYMKNRKSAV